MTIAHLKALLAKHDGAAHWYDRDFANRALMDSIPALIAVAEAARKYLNNLGQTHYWRCRSLEGPNQPHDYSCTCGMEQLSVALAALTPKGEEDGRD